MTGWVDSTNLIGSVGSPQPAHAVDGAQSDAFVARLHPDLGTLEAFTYLGGNGDDAGFAIDVTSGGTVVVAGNTTSTNLPGTTGAAQPTAPAAANNGFLAILTPDLQTLQRLTYFGGNGDTQLSAVITGQSELYITGTTAATNLPATAGAAQPSRAGGDDAFVARVQISLQQVFRTTYFGAGGDENGKAVAVHPQTKDVYIGGQADGSTLPAIAGGAQAVKGGGNDAFVARFSSDLTVLRQSTWYGGNSTDQITALVVHPISGDIYGSGFTDSLTLPNTAGGAQPVQGGGSRDGYAVWISADLRTIHGATYIGGTSSNESATAIAAHPVSGEIYVAGQTGSTTFPGTAGGAQSVFGGVLDAYVVRLRQDLSLVIQSTYIGGSGSDSVTSIAIHPLNRDIYVTGTASAAGLPGAANGAFTAPQGALDGFITRITPDLTAVDKTPDPFAFAPVFGAIPSSTVRSSALVTGFTGSASTYITGGPNARYCISTTIECGCDIVASTTSPSSTIAGRYICAADSAGTAPNQTKMSIVHVGGGAAIQLIVTGAALALPCSLDIDGNGANDALTDGLIVLRALFGLTGTSVTNGAIGGGAQRTTWATLQPYLNGSCAGNFSP